MYRSELDTLNRELNRKIEAQLERDLRMIKLFSRTVAWFALIFLILAICASYLNSTLVVQPTTQEGAR